MTIISQLKHWFLKKYINENAWHGSWSTNFCIRRCHLCFTHPDWRPALSFVLLIGECAELQYMSELQWILGTTADQEKSIGPKTVAFIIPAGYKDLNKFIRHFSQNLHWSMPGVHARCQAMSGRIFWFLQSFCENINKTSLPNLFSPDFGIVSKVQKYSKWILLRRE